MIQVAFAGQRPPEDLVQERLQELAPDRLLTERFTHFCACYSAIIRRMSTRHGLPENERDDVVQEVWVAVFTTLPAHGLNTGQDSLRAWLWTLIRNKSMDVLRRRSRRPEGRLDDVLRTPAEPVDPQADPVRQWRHITAPGVHPCSRPRTTRSPPRNGWRLPTATASPRGNGRC